MDKTVMLLLSKGEFETLIIDCFNSCLKFQPVQKVSNELNPFLNINEAATLLNLSLPTVYGLVSKSKIPYAKKGKRLYFSRQELTDWIQSGRKKTDAEIIGEAENSLLNKKRLNHGK